MAVKYIDKIKVLRTVVMNKSDAISHDNSFSVISYVNGVRPVARRALNA